MTEHEMQKFKQFYYLVETLKIHGEINYGTSDINVEALVNYLNHPSMVIRCWGDHSAEHMDELVMQDIIDGMPVWSFFNLSPWAQEMQRRDYEAFRAEEERLAAGKLEADKKKYKCLQGCVHYDYGETPMGVFVRCKAKHVGGDDFKLCQRCKHFSTEPVDWRRQGMKPRIGG